MKKKQLITQINNIWNNSVENNKGLDNQQWNLVKKYIWMLESNITKYEHKLNVKDEKRIIQEIN